MNDLTTNEREWLLERLRELIAARGAETFVAAPVVQATPAHFPDPWNADPAGLQVVARRLLWHAGLGGHRARLIDHRALLKRPGTLRVSHWSTQLVEGELELKLHELGNDDVVGILCHEVGWAFRQIHGLDAVRVPPFRTSQAEIDEAAEAAAEEARALGSLTTVYLGLGLLATNASHAVRHVQGNMHAVEWATTLAGGLPVETMAFLCAVHAVVRGDADDYADLLPNQKDLFRRFSAELADGREALLLRLGLPDEPAWPAEREPAVMPFTDEVYEVPVAQASAGHDDSPWNVGRPVFRVRGDRGWLLGGLGTMLGTLSGLALTDFSWVVTCTMVAGAAGFLAGRGLRADRCSDTDCEVRLSPADRVCPHCGREVAGEIRTDTDRLGAEEAWCAQRGVRDPLEADALAYPVEPNDEEDGFTGRAAPRRAGPGTRSPSPIEPDHRRPGDGTTPGR